MRIVLAITPGSHQGIVDCAVGAEGGMVHRVLVVIAKAGLITYVAREDRYAS